MGKVLKADCDGGDAYVYKDLTLPGGGWYAQYRLLIPATTMAVLRGLPSGSVISAAFFEIDEDDGGGSFSSVIYNTLGDDPTYDAAGITSPATFLAWAGATTQTESSIIPEDTWVDVEAHFDGTDVHYTIAGTAYPGLDGPLVGTPSRLRVGGFFSNGLVGEIYYLDDVKIGTTLGGDDIFGDDFESGTLAAWDNALGTVSVVDDPAGSPPPTPPNPDCADATDLSGATAGHVEASNNGWAGSWPTGADPLFEYYGHGGGAPLWWKWTNPGSTPVQFKATIGHPADTTDEISGTLNVGLAKGSCGSLTIDAGGPHFINTVAQISTSDTGDSASVDIIVEAGETVFLEIDVNGSDTSEPPTPSEEGSFAFDWLITATATQDCMEDSTTIGDLTDGITPMGDANDGTRVYDSILVGDKLYVAFELDYYDTPGPPGVGPHYTYRVAVVNTDGSGLAVYELEDHAYKDFQNFPGANAIHTTGGSHGNASAFGEMRLVYDGENVVVAVMTKEGVDGLMLGSCTSTYYVNLYREDGGAWTNIATIASETDNEDDNFRGYRFTASPATPGTAWLGMIGIRYVTLGLVEDRFTRYEIDLSTGAVTTLYDDVEQAGDWDSLTPVGTSSWDLISDDGYPILLWEKHSAFSTSPDPTTDPIVEDNRVAYDGFVTVERFDTKAAIRTISRPQASHTSGDDHTMVDGRSRRYLKTFAKFACDETGYDERFVSISYMNLNPHRFLFRIRSDFTTGPEQIESAAFDPVPGENPNPDNIPGHEEWAWQTPLYDGERNVWAIGIRTTARMFQYDRRCFHEWSEALGLSVQIPGGEQDGGWDADTYFYFADTDLQVNKLGPILRDCELCFPDIASLGLFAWQTF